MPLTIRNLMNATGRVVGATWRSGSRRVVTMASLQVIVIWILAVGEICQERHEAIDDWKRTGEIAGLTVASHMAQTLGAADLVLKSMQDWISQEDIQSEDTFRRVMSERRFHDALRDRTIGLPQFSVAGILARNGDVLNITFEYPPPAVNLAEREAVKIQISPSSPDVSLTATSPSRSSGRWTFYLVRKVQAKSGEVLGVVAVGLDADYFARLFRQISIGEDSWISLFRSDGSLLATSLPQPGLVGRRYQSFVAQDLMERNGSGRAVLTDQPTWFAPTTPHPRIVVPRKVEGYSAFISLVIGESVVFAHWKEMVWGVLAVAFVLTAVTAFVAHRLLRLTRRAEATTRIEAEQRLMTAIVDTPAALTAVIDRDRNIVHANTRFRRIFGDDFDLRAALHDPSVRGIDALLVALDQAAPLAEIELELELARPAARMRRLHFSLSRQSLPGAGDCTIMVGRDETERLQAQQAVAQSAKLAALGEMSSGIAHELAQPLNVIRMAAQNVLSEIEPEAPGEGGDTLPFEPLSDEAFRDLVAGKLHRMVGQVDRAAEILARMRIFTRDARQGAQPFDVRDACRGAAMAVQRQFQRAGIVLRQGLGDEGLVVVGHRAPIEQVLINLLRNACDALRDDARSEKIVELSARRDADGRIKVLVSDNGPGIAPDIRDRIFEPFFTTKPVGQGTGLGLATAFGLVRDAGGTLSLVNGGVGATFEIDLPPRAAS
jgi:signal transduction histidine kinase